MSRLQLASNQNITTASVINSSLTNTSAAIYSSNASAAGYAVQAFGGSGFAYPGFTFPARDATTVTIENNSGNSAVYAHQQNVNGWAGYFSGRVNVNNGTSTVSALSVTNNSTGRALDVVQLNSTGWAGYFSGGLAVTGLNSPSLRIFNTLPSLSSTPGTPLGHSFMLGGLAETNNQSDGAQWRFYEAEGLDLTVPVGAGCVINLQQNEISASGGKAIRMDNCNAGTIITHTPRIVLPRGTYRATVRVRGLNFPDDARVYFGIVRQAVFQQETAIYTQDLPDNGDWATVGTQLSTKDLTTDFVFRFLVGGNMGAGSYIEFDSIQIEPAASNGHISGVKGYNIVLDGTTYLKNANSSLLTKSIVGVALTSPAETCVASCLKSTGNCIVGIDVTGGNFDCASTNAARDYCLCGTPD